MQLMRSRLFLIAALALLAMGGCATSPYQSDAKTRSDDLLNRQLAEAKNQNQQPKLWFAGFGLHSSSTAFKLDVAGFAKAAKAIDPNAAIFQLTNPAPSQPKDWPYATPENIETVLREMAANMGSKDVALVLLTTHGHVDLLAFNANSVEYAPIRGASLTKWFEPLNSKRTVVVVSACYSGSLIGSLIHPNRIILTAAARDRTSFGCQPNSRNTFFVEDLLLAMADPSKNIATAFETTKSNVQRKEAVMKLTPPSDPQIRIPPSQTEFSRKPFKEWFIY